MSAALVSLYAGPLEVIRATWLESSEGVRLELELSDGSFVLVGFDTEYNAPDIFRAADESEDYVSCVARETGLGDAIAPLIDEVAAAQEAFDSNLRAEDDDSAADRWNQHGGGGR